MNYNSVEKILAAGTTNMTVIRDGVKNDDETDAITGVSWFTFNDKVASTIYVNGNSWLGFGESKEHLKVNQRDGNMWYLYREEGTLYNYYKFLKIRFSGYGWFSYSPPHDYHQLIYDVILWDTGDISLHVITLPESYIGTFSLTASSTYSYTVSESSPDVTFKKTDSGYEVQNNVIYLDLPYERRYLLRDGSTIYTIVEEALLSLGEVPITPDLFLNSGVEEIPDFSLISTMSNPEFLYWHDIEDEIYGLKIGGIPPLPQVVTYAPQTIPPNSSIKIMEAEATSDVLFTITFDGGQIWKYYDTIDQTWTDSTVLTEGMTCGTLMAIMELMWSEIATSDTYQIRCVLPSATSTVKKVLVGYTD